MKKIIIISMLLLAAVVYFAANPRVYVQWVTLNDGSNPPNCPLDGTSPNPDYIYSVYNSSNPLDVIATNTASNPNNVCIKLQTTSGKVIALVNQSLFAANWPIGSTLYCTVTYIPTNESVTWTRVVPSGSTINDINEPKIIPPTVASTHIISGTISSQWDLSGVTISATGIEPNNITYNAVTGAYSVTVPDGWSGNITPFKTDYIFEPPSYSYTDPVVADIPNQNFTMKTVVVPGVPTNLSPPNGTILTYNVVTPVVLSWDAVTNAEGYKLIWNNGEVQDLGTNLTFTTPPLGAGTYTWKVCAYNNTATKKFNAPVRVQINSRSTSTTNSPKVDGGWAEASFEVVIVANTWTYNLTMTASDNGAYEFTDPQGGVHTTPAILTDGPGDEANGLLGTYTVTSAPPAGFTWQSTTIEVVAGDFTAAKTDYVYNAAKQFVLVPIPDTYTYNLHINGPEGYAVTGPNAGLSGTIPYTKTSTVVTDLVGNYTVAAPPAGYQWVMNPITVTADMFQLTTKKTGGMNKVVLGSRTNGAKAHYVYEATITFVMEPIPVQYYNVLITSEPAGAAILVDNVDTGFVTPYTFTMEEGASATYTVVMDHYTWNPTEFVVTNISENMSCNFVGTPYYDIPDGVPTTPTGATVTVTITITGGNANYGSGVLPPWVNPSFTPIEQYFLSLIGTGPWTITFNTTAPWAAYFLGGIWHAVQNSGVEISFTVTAAKDIEDLPIILGESDPTLPVELSYFAATLTAENFVNIAWTTQTETNMNGFNIYRNDGSDNLASANRIAYIPATNTSTTQNYNLLDREVEIGHTYYYWLECVEISGHSTFNGPYPIYVNGPTPPVLPEYTKMHNAYPNPFRAGSGTTIAVEVKKGDSGTVTIYNILGQVVKTFSLTEGTNNLNWNGRDSKGNLCGNGIYFYKLSTNSLNQTKKMVIVK